MSGELRASEDWAVAEPRGERRRRWARKEKTPPRTRKEVVLRGLRRLAITLVLIAGATALVALLVVQLAGTSPERTFALAFIFVGAGLLALAFFHQSGQESEWYRDREEHEVALNWSTVYALFGVLMLAIGLTLDYVL
jgi:FtsH-binding integral membrane protein